MTDSQSCSLPVKQMCAKLPVCYIEAATNISTVATGALCAGSLTIRTTGYSMFISSCRILICQHRQHVALGIAQLVAILHVHLLRAGMKDSVFWCTTTYHTPGISVLPDPAAERCTHCHCEESAACSEDLAQSVHHYSSATDARQAVRTTPLSASDIQHVL